MASTGAPGACGYRPWLDGVRAVAILLVLLQHVTGITSIGFGGTGVGLFFALSGYLITGLLLDEHARFGKLNLRRFYVRRAARLLPALGLMVAVTGLALIVLGLPRLVLGAVPALLYLSNYVAIVVGSWHPVYGPTWSLAVEEHFYAVWPLVMLAVLARRPSPRRVLHAALAICALSLAWRVVLVLCGASNMFTYVGSLARADALLFGCAAAAAVRLGWRPGRALLLVGAALVAGYACLPVLGGQIHGSTVLGIGGALVVASLDCSRAATARRSLSTRPAVRLGEWSYGVYLWHVPALFVAGQLGVETVTGRLLVVVFVVAMAGCSNRWFETPIRDRVRRSQNTRPQIPVKVGSGVTTFIAS